MTGGSTLYNRQTTTPEQYQLNDLRRLTGIKVPIRRMPLARLCERKIASATTSTVVGRLQSLTQYPPPRTLVRMASPHCLLMDPRGLCSTNDQTGWNHILGVRVHIPAGEAPETPSHRLNLAGVGISLPTCYTNTSPYPNGSGDPGIWSPRNLTQVSRETGRAVGERDILPHRRLLHILHRPFMDIPGGGVATRDQYGGHPCPTDALHLGIPYVYLSPRRYHLPPHLGLRCF